MEALAKQPHDPDLPRDRPAINCPLCRAEVTLPDKGIEGLPSNFSVTRLVETVQLQDKFEQNKTQKCDSCIEGDAVASCCECGGFFLCKNCLSVHKKLPSTKAHSMLSLNQLVQLGTPFAANKSLLCQRHPQEPLKLYCEDCEALVCRDCVLVRHKLHNYNFVADIIDEEKDRLQDVTLKELTEILGSTKEAISDVEQMQAKVLSCNEQHIGQLNKTFEEIADMLNNRKRTFLVEVRQVTEDDLCPLQKQQEDLVTIKEKIKSCHDFTQKTLRDGTSAEIMSAKKQMIERTKHLQELHSNSPMTPVTKPSTTVFYQMDKIKEVVNSLGVVIDLQQSSLKDIPEKIHVDKGDSVSISVVLKDTKDQPVSNASKAIAAEVTLDNKPVTSMVLESGKGKYSVTFTPTGYRNHIISIRVNGHHISNSPTELKIYVQDSSEQDVIKVSCYQTQALGLKGVHAEANLPYSQEGGKRKDAAWWYKGEVKSQAPYSKSTEASKITNYLISNATEVVVAAQNTNKVVKAGQVYNECGIVGAVQPGSSTTVQCRSNTTSENMSLTKSYPFNTPYALFNQGLRHNW